MVDDPQVLRSAAGDPAKAKSSEFRDCVEIQHKGPVGPVTLRVEFVGTDGEGKRERIIEEGKKQVGKTE